MQTRDCDNKIIGSDRSSTIPLIILGVSGIHLGAPVITVTDYSVSIYSDLSSSCRS